MTMIDDKELGILVGHAWTHSAEEGDGLMLRDLLRERGLEIAPIPREKTAEEVEFDEARDELLRSCGAKTLGTLPDRFLAACDPEARRRGELKPRKPKPKVTLEELRERYPIKMRFEGKGWVASCDAHSIQACHADLNEAAQAVLSISDNVLGTAIDNGTVDQLPKPRGER